MGQPHQQWPSVPHPRAPLTPPDLGPSHNPSCTARSSPTSWLVSSPVDLTQAPPSAPPPSRPRPSLPPRPPSTPPPPSPPPLPSLPRDKIHRGTSLTPSGCDFRQVTALSGATVLKALLMRDGEQMIMAGLTASGRGPRKPPRRPTLPSRPLGAAITRLLPPEAL